MQAALPKLAIVQDKEYERNKTEEGKVYVGEHNYVLCLLILICLAERRKLK